MKKYFYSVLAAGMLFATSCSQDEMLDITKAEDQKVTYTVQIPDVAESRAINPYNVNVGEGKLATKLIYALYENGAHEKGILKAGFVDDAATTGETPDGKFNVSLTLAKNINYDILFMAYNPDNCAFVLDNSIASNNNLKALTIDMANLKANQEQYDAFVGRLVNQNIHSASNHVDLKRPFAQVNAATTAADLEAVKELKTEITKSQVVIYNAPTTLNIFDNSVNGNETLTYGAEAILTKYGETEYPTNEDLVVNTATFKYLAMAYVLADTDGSTHDVDFTFYRSDNRDVSDLTVTGMPIQANFRTNIVGTLLTESEDYTIEIDDDFGGDINKDEIVYTQAAFEQALAEGGTIYLGKNNGSRTLTADYVWKPTNKSFEIVAIEEGVTIDMNCAAYQSIGGHSANVVFNGVTLIFNGIGYSGFYDSISETYKNCHIEGCCWTYAKNAKFEGCTFNQSGDNYNIWVYVAGNITVKDCEFNSYCKSILIYSEFANEYSVTIENSTFTSQEYDEKAAVQMHTEYGIHGTLTMSNVEVSGKYSEFQKNLGWFNEINKSTKQETNNFQKNITIAEGVAWANDEYMISNDKGMFWFANEVNLKNNSFAGKIVKLAADIYMAGQAWTPVGQAGATQFKGTFDGQNKTIFNLSIDKTAQTGGNYSSGLFGWLNAATVKNVTVTDATVKGNHNVGVIAGYLETAGCTIENCHVSGATVECHVANADANGDKAGVIVGHAGNEGVVVNNCTAKNSTVSAGRDAGQIVGAAKEANVTDCSATNVTVTANGEGTGANVRNEVIGRVL